MGTSLTIDRSDLADTAQPDKLAELIIAQLLPQLPKLLPLPIEDVAVACGILEIQPLETEAFEGGLIQDQHKERGFILVKAGQRLDRTRFTIAHELGHFVNLRHVAPAGTDKLLCNKADLLAAGPSVNPRFGMEAQANEFAASLLMPRTELVPLPLMKGSPEISRILTLQTLCQVSKEAAARRYLELHGDDFAVVFSKDGKFIYGVRGGEFPSIDLTKGQTLFRGSLTCEFDGDDGEISAQEDGDPCWWLRDKDIKSWEIWEEVLVQQDGYKMTMLLGSRVDED